jgi:hypothetical protein
VSVLSQWSTVIILGGINGALLWFAWSGKAGWNLMDFLVAWTVFWLGLFWLMMANDLRKARLPAGWLAASDEHGLFIKWRSYQNIGWGTDGPQVVFVSWRDIRQARRLDQTWITRESQNSQTQETRRYVELDLVRGISLAELRRILADERDGRPGGVKMKTKWGHFPVSIEGESTIRVEWRSRTSIARFIEELRSWVAIDEPARATNDSTVADVADATLEELARRGDVMALTATIRLRDDVSLAEARTLAQAMMAEGASKDE